MFTYATVFCTLIVSLFVLHCEAEVLGPSLETLTCKISQHNIFSDTSNKYIKKLKDFTCGSNHPLIRSDRTHLWIDTKIKTAMGLTGHMRCCYKSFWGNKAHGDLLSSVRFNKNCVNFSNKVRVLDEFIMVFCYNKGREVYRDVHGFVKETKRFSARKFKDEKPSVLVIGLHAVSRENLIRQMPLTSNFLNDSDIIELRGYSKVGISMFENGIATLTGLKEAEFQNTCIKNDIIAVNKCPLLWKEFQKQGYVTAYGEDTTFWGSFLNNKYGFDKIPTDIFLRPFMIMNEHPNGVGQVLVEDKKCSGPRPTLRVFLDYVEKFIDDMNMRKTPYFANFWVDNYSPDFFNIYPIVDKIIHSFFKKLINSNASKNTVVVFISSQGLSYGDFRTTKLGSVEEKHPFSFIMLPSAFIRNNSNAFRYLQINQERLTSHFDLGATLRHLISNKSLANRFTFNRGVSLFSYIPNTRTCYEASISDYSCPCQRPNEIQTYEDEEHNFVVPYRKLQYGIRKTKFSWFDRNRKARNMP